MQQILKIKTIFCLFLQLSLTLTLCYSQRTMASQVAKNSPITWDKLDLSDRIKEKLKNDNDVFCESEVESFDDDKKQSLQFFIAGLHPKSCRVALTKLSQYERFSEFLDFVERSQYNEEKKRIRLNMGHTLMPFNMILDFSIPRITGNWPIPFSF